jgi:tripartite-type tricarboxylate transporter receptor subunit TctC
MAYYGLHGPKGLSAEVVQRLHAATKRTAELPEVKKRIEDTGSLLVLGSPAEFGQQMAAELAVYQKVVAQQKLKLD